MFADEVALSASDQAYVTNTFSGAFNGAGYTISGLLKPLFSSLGTGARVENLSLKDVAINATTPNTAALAHWHKRLKMQTSPWFT